MYYRTLERQVASIDTLSMRGQQLRTAIVEKEGPEGSGRKYHLCLLIGAFIP
jgi:hypothetical protein